jgi:hypothetical protein
MCGRPRSKKGRGKLISSEMQPRFHAPPAAVAYSPYSGSEG